MNHLSIRSFLGGLGVGVAGGAVATALLGLASVYTHHPMLVKYRLDQQLQVGCDDLGASRVLGDEERVCLPVPGSELGPGRVVTRADLKGVWMPVDYVSKDVARDPSGRTVARRLLPGEVVREARLHPVTP